MSHSSTGREEETRCLTDIWSDNFIFELLLFNMYCRDVLKNMWLLFILWTAVKQVLNCIPCDIIMYKSSNITCLCAGTKSFIMSADRELNADGADDNKLVRATTYWLLYWLFAGCFRSDLTFSSLCVFRSGRGASFILCYNMQEPRKMFSPWRRYSLVIFSCLFDVFCGKMLLLNQVSCTF